MAHGKQDALFTEGIDYPAQKADDSDIYCDDDATLAAQKSFHITYLYPWQRIVIANILDSFAGVTASDDFESPLTEQETSTWQEVCDDKTAEANVSTSAATAENASCSTDDVLSRTKALQNTSDLFCNGRQIVLLPTGAGKSLCFLIPALLLPGATLVLYPLLALMADQKRRMDEAGMVSVIFRGQQTEAEREENFKKIHEGAKIILANPEVLQNKILVRRLAECHIAHIAIDEAHCVSEWGDTFRPAYLTLGDIIKTIAPPVVTAFTATASPQVLARVAQVLFDGEAHIVRSDSDRPNIHYTVINTFAKKRTAFKLAVTMKKPLIIFCGTRKHAEDMARELGAYYGTDRVKFYHAGLAKEEKNIVEKWFYPKTDAVLCCTCAFGMGVDKKDIHTIIHLDVPATAEAYIQEAGRGGRDGTVADAVLLWSHADSVKGNTFAPDSRARVLKVFAESKTCRRQILLDALGGEQAACDGCDVCLRHGPAPFADDASFALNYIFHHRRLFTRDELYARLEKELNNADLKEFGTCIWEHADILDMLQQLESAGYLRTCLWPWYKKIDCANGKRQIASRYRSPTWQKLFLLQERIVSQKKKILLQMSSPLKCHLFPEHFHFLLKLKRLFSQRRLLQLQQRREICGPSEAFSGNVPHNSQAKCTEAGESS